MFLERMDPGEVLREVMGISGGGQATLAGLQRRLRVLGDLDVRLAMEVEALRENEVWRSWAAGGSPSASGYAAAYRDTALLTHNAAGPRSGWDRLLGELLPGAAEAHELRMMRRLGFSDERIERHLAEVPRPEELT